MAAGGKKTNICNQLSRRDSAVCNGIGQDVWAQAQRQCLTAPLSGGVQTITKRCGDEFHYYFTPMDACIVRNVPSLLPLFQTCREMPRRHRQIPAKAPRLAISIELLDPPAATKRVKKLGDALLVILPPGIGAGVDLAGYGRRMQAENPGLGIVFVKIAPGDDRAAIDMFKALRLRDEAEAKAITSGKTPIAVRIANIKHWYGKRPQYRGRAVAGMTVLEPSRVRETLNAKGEDFVVVADPQRRGDIERYLRRLKAQHPSANDILLVDKSDSRAAQVSLSALKIPDDKKTDALAARKPVAYRFDRGAFKDEIGLSRIPEPIIIDETNFDDYFGKGLSLRPNEDVIIVGDRASPNAGKIASSTARWFGVKRLIWISPDMLRKHAQLFRKLGLEASPRKNGFAIYCVTAQKKGIKALPYPAGGFFNVSSKEMAALILGRQTPTGSTLYIVGPNHEADEGSNDMQRLRITLSRKLSAGGLVLKGKKVGRIAFIDRDHADEILDIGSLPKVNPRAAALAGKMNSAISAHGAPLEAYLVTGGSAVPAAIPISELIPASDADDTEEGLSRLRDEAAAAFIRESEGEAQRRQMERLRELRFDGAMEATISDLKGHVDALEVSKPANRNALAAALDAAAAIRAQIKGRPSRAPSLSKTKGQSLDSRLARLHDSLLKKLQSLYSLTGDPDDGARALAAFRMAEELNEHDPDKVERLNAQEEVFRAAIARRYAGEVAKQTDTDQIENARTVFNRPDRLLDDAPLLRTMGKIYAESGKPHLAVAAYERGRLLKPRNPYFTGFLAALLHRMPRAQDKARALALLRTYIGELEAQGANAQAMANARRTLAEWDRQGAAKRGAASPEPAAAGFAPGGQAKAAKPNHKGLKAKLDAIERQRGEILAEAGAIDPLSADAAEKFGALTEKTDKLEDTVEELPAGRPSLAAIADPDIRWRIANARKDFGPENKLRAALFERTLERIRRALAGVRASMPAGSPITAAREIREARIRNLAAFADGCIEAMPEDSRAGSPVQTARGKLLRLAAHARGTIFGLTGDEGDRTAAIAAYDKAIEGIPFGIDNGRLAVWTRELTGVRDRIRCADIAKELRDIEARPDEPPPTAETYGPRVKLLQDGLAKLDELERSSAGSAVIEELRQKLNARLSATAARLKKALAAYLPPADGPQGGPQGAPRRAKKGPKDYDAAIELAGVYAAAVKFDAVVRTPDIEAAILSARLRVAKYGLTRLAADGAADGAAAIAAWQSAVALNASHEDPAENVRLAAILDRYAQSFTASVAAQAATKAPAPAAPAAAPAAATPEAASAAAVAKAAAATPAESTPGAGASLSDRIRAFSAAAGAIRKRAADFNPRAEGAVGEFTGLISEIESAKALAGKLPKGDALKKVSDADQRTVIKAAHGYFEPEPRLLLFALRAIAPKIEVALGRTKGPRAGEAYTDAKRAEQASLAGVADAYESAASGLTGGDAGIGAIKAQAALFTARARKIIFLWSRDAADGVKAVAAYETARASNPHLRSSIDAAIEELRTAIPSWKPSEDGKLPLHDDDE